MPKSKCQKNVKVQRQDYGRRVQITFLHSRSSPELVSATDDFGISFEIEILFEL
jgi:hypothetical protein